MNSKVTVSLEFAKIKVIVESSLCNTIGLFDQFCLRAIGDGLFIDSIAELTCIENSIIEERYTYLRNHQFLTENNGLSKKGELLLEHLKIVDWFTKYPLEIIVDTKSASIVLAAEQFESVISQTPGIYRTKPKINVLDFVLTNKYNLYIHRKCTVIINRLHEKDLDSLGKDYPFIFQFTDSERIYIPIMLDMAIPNAKTEKSVKEKSSDDIDIIVELIESEYGIYLPIIELLDKKYLAIIKEVGEGSTWNTIAELSENLRNVLVRCDIIETRDSGFNLGVLGRKVYNNLKAKETIEAEVRCTLKSEANTGIIFLDNTKCEEDVINVLTESTPLDNEKRSQWSKYFGIDKYLPEINILKPRYFLKGTKRIIVDLHISKSVVLKEMHKIGRKRLLTGSGWNCIGCGHTMDSAEWNRLIVIDDYPISYKALYNCPACNNQVELSHLLPGSSSVFIDENCEIIER